MVGAIVDDARRLVGDIKINNFPLSSLQVSRPVGRPRQDDVKLAVLLVWALHNAATGGGHRGDADAATADELHYAGEREVKRIRNPLLKKYVADARGLFFFHVDGETACGDYPQRTATLIPKPDVSRTTTGEVVVSGKCVYWAHGMAKAVKRGKVDFNCTLPDEIVSRLEKGVAIILTLIQPG